MSDHGSFEGEYKAALYRYLEIPTESGLAAAYELGRDALRRGVSLLELSALHTEALTEVVQRGRLSREVLEASGSFLNEALATLEMTQRGFWESQTRARTEENRVRQLRRLAEAFVAIAGERLLYERVDLLGEQARLVTGAQASRVSTFADRYLIPFTSADQEGAAAGCSSYPVLADEVRPDMCQRKTADETSCGAGWMGLPIARRDEGLIAVIELWAAPGTEFSDFDEVLGLQFSRFASVAVENAWLYEREHRVALTLQRSLLPGSLPTIPGLDLAARYLPAGAEVGGDWYDAIPITDRRIALTVGDVTGHGVASATMMARLRFALQAYVVAGYEPTGILAKLNEVLLRAGTEVLATVIYVEVDLDRLILRLANAGHPPPLLIGPDGQATLVQEGLSLLLGVQNAEPAARSVVERATQPGSLLLLYTDGIIDMRRQGPDERLELLVSLATHFDGSADALCDRVLA